MGVSPALSSRGEGRRGKVAGGEIGGEGAREGKEEVGSVDLHQEHHGSTGSRGAVGSVDQPFVGSDVQGGQLTGYLWR